jgi:uncharacterized protein (DUF2062 family)
VIAGFKRSLRYQAIRLFRMEGSREKIARGFAIGMVFNFFPTFGLGAVVSGFVARLFGGNILAGFIGGSTLAIFWPVLFYLNMRVGSLFLRPPQIVDSLDDVTPQAVDALVWGRTFFIGSVLNSLVVGLAAYFLFLLVYERIKVRSLRRLQADIRERRETSHSENGLHPKIPPPVSGDAPL